MCQGLVDNVGEIDVGDPVDDGPHGHQLLELFLALHGCPEASR